MSHDACSAEYSLDSFPCVQAYYFVVDASSLNSSRFRLSPVAEEPKEVVEGEEHLPCAEEVEEGALRSSLQKDERRSEQRGWHCCYFLLDSQVIES